MGIAKSLRKAGRLSSFGKGLSDVLNSITQEDSLDQYLQLVNQKAGDIRGRFEGQPNPERQSMFESTFNDPFLMGRSGGDREFLLQNILNEPGKTPDPMANKKALGDIAEFVLSSLGKKGIDENLKQSSISGLDLLRQSLAPDKKAGPKLKGINPEYDVYDETTGKLVKEGDQKPTTMKTGDKFKGISAKGYWEVDNSDPANPQLKWIENEDYKPDPTGKDDSYADFSKLIGEVGEGIGKINLIKTAKQDSKSKLFNVPDPFGLGNYELTQEELNTLKEQVKTIYSDKAITLVTQQGLQPAVEDMRLILKKENNNINKAISKFKELNPDFTPDQIRILKDYFTLFLQ